MRCLRSVKKTRTVKTNVLDSYARLAYLEKEEGWDTVAQLLADAAADRCGLYGCVVNWGEVLYITERVYGPAKAEEVEAILSDLPIEWVDADEALTREASRFKVDGGLAYADCFAAALARQREGEVLTGDPEFERVTDQVDVRWLTPD
jgi:predicted nucleic acid-binding protein